VRSSRLALMMAGAVFVSLPNSAWSNDKPADALPSAPLLADPLLTNPLLVDGSLQGHCWGGASCGGSLASLTSSGAEVPSATTNVSPMTAAPDFFSDILAPTSASSGSAGGGIGGAGGSSGIGSIATLSNGSLDTSKSAIPPISSGASQGTGGGSTAQGSTGPIRTASATVPDNTATGPLSKLVTGDQGPGLADPIVNFLGPASLSSPNFDPAGDVIPIALNTAPEPESFGLLAAGLVILGAAGWMFRARAGVPVR